MAKRRGNPYGFLPALGGRVVFFWLLALLAAPSLWAAAESVTFLSASNYAGVTYDTNSSVTFHVQAKTGGGANDPTFGDPVTVGFYDSSTNLPAQPQGVWVTAGGAPVTGATAALQFVGGVLDFGVTLTAGSDSMYVSIFDSNISSGNVYPTATPGYQVRGFFETYYMEPSSGNSTPAVYAASPTPGPVDLLLNIASAASTASSSELPVTVAYSTGVAGSFACAVTGVNAGYAAGGAGISFSLGLEKLNGSATTPVSIEVILDFDGTLADYDNPRAQDAVYFASIPNVFRLLGNGSGPNIFPGQMTKISGPAILPAFMTNGQIIFRAWTSSSTDPVYLLWADGNKNDTSKINVPYASGNVQPIRSILTVPGSAATPATVLAGGNPVTLIDTFHDLFNVPVTQIVLSVPPNNPTSGTYWHLPTIHAPGGNSAISVDPTGSTPGTITIDCTSSPVVFNEDYAVTLIGTASGQDFAWPITMLSNLTNAGTNAPQDNANAVVQTLGAPDTPGSFTAAPVSFLPAQGGNAVSLSWSQSVSENPLGYVIVRSPTAGALFGTVTLPDGQNIDDAVTVMPASIVNYIDTSATNQTGFTYTIQAFNNVTQSGASSPIGPVTAFVNPGKPTNVSAMTSNGAVTITWASPTATPGTFPLNGYQIWRDTQPSMAASMLIGSVGSGVSGYNDTTASNGTQYYYEVATIDQAYSSGDPDGVSAHISGLSSSPLSGFPAGFPPTNLQAQYTPTPINIRVSWTAPVSYLNAPVSYLINRQDNGSGPYNAMVTLQAPTTSYDDSAIAIGGFYNYEIKSWDGSAYSNPATVTGYTVPSAPSNLIASAGPAASGSITLSWDPLNGEGVSQYDLYRDGGPTPVATITYPTVTLTDLAASFGVTHVYTLSAVNAGGEGSKSLPVTSAILPNAPAGGPITATNSNVVTFGWATPSPAQPDVTGYTLTRSDNGVFGSGTTVQLGTGQAGYSYTDVLGASAPGSILYYYVQAENIGGLGDHSLAVGVQVPPHPPATPTAVSGAAAITLTWTANGASDAVTYYTVYRDGGSGFVSVGTANSPGVTFVDTTANGLSLGVDYTYKMTASNPGLPVTVAGGESQASGTVVVGLAPDTVTGFGVTVTGASLNNVNATWGTLSANNANAVSYILSRGPSSVLGAATPIATLAVTVAGNPVTSQLDVTALTPGTIYYYFLQAQNSYGTGSAVVQGVQIPPNAPATPTFSSSSSGVTLSWTANVAGDNVSKYAVYRSLSSGSGYVSIGSVNNPTVNYTDATASAGVDYYYKISAFDPGSGATIVGGESLLSGFVNAGRLPQTPAGLAVVGIDTSNNISLSWTGVTGVDPNASSVSLLVSNTNNSAAASQVYITPANTITYLDQGVFNNAVTGEAPDTTYYYWLATNSTYGSSALTGPVSKLTYPAPVSLQTVFPDPNGVSRLLTWTPVGGADVNSYTIYREQYGASSFVSVGSAAASGLSFPVTVSNSVLPGKQYIYKVTALNATGEGTNQNFITIGIKPSAPVSLTAVSGVSASGVTVNLTWTDANYINENVVGYTLYRSTSATGPFVAVTAPGSVAASSVTTTYSDGSGPLTGGTTYYYLAEAYSAAGDESVQVTANAVAVTAYALPNPSAISTEIDGNGTAALTWGAATATSYPVSIYNVYASGNGGATQLVGSSASLAATVSLSNGVTYNLFLKTVDSQGHLSALSGPMAGLPVAPPGVPGSVGAAPGNDTNQVSWTVSTTGSLPVSYYLVREVDTTGPVTVVYQVPGNLTGYLDTAVTNTGIYDYYVEAVDSSGSTIGTHVSGFTAGAAVTTGQLVINPPGNLLAASSSAQVALSWQDSIGSSIPVTAYQIYRASGVGAYTPLAMPATVASQPNGYIDSSVLNGTTYHYYLVSLTDTAGITSAASATVVGAPAGPPGPVTGLTASDGVSQVTLKWTTPALVDNVPVTGFIVYENGSAAVTLANTPSLPATNLTRVGLTPGTYTYYLVTMNANGVANTSPSATVTAYPYDLTAPTGLTSSSSAGGVTMTAWTAPGTSTFSISYYQLLRGTASGGETPLTITGSPVTGISPPLVDTSGVVGTNYYYELEAVDNKGHVSPVSNEITDSPANAINAPATVLISAGDGQVLLDWQAPVSAAGSLPVSEYIVTPINGSTGTAVTVIAGSPWNLQIPLIDGTPVSFTVQAVDTTGQTSGSHISAPVTVTTTPANLGVYNPPTGLAATAVNSNVQLTWTRPNDMGQLVLSYNVYRMGSFTSTLGSPVTNLPDSALAPVTSFMDATAAANTTYYYVVRAVYQTNPPPTTTESPSSNHALVTTGAPNKVIPPVTVGQMGFDANVFKPLDGEVLGIYYVVPKTGPVEIDAYNIKGYPVKYMDPGVAQAGVQTSTTWDGSDRNGKTVASGVYLIEIKANGLHQIKKVIVVK